MLEPIEYKSTSSPETPGEVPLELLDLLGHHFNRVDKNRLIDMVQSGGIPMDAKWSFFDAESQESINLKTTATDYFPDMKKFTGRIILKSGDKEVYLLQVDTGENLVLVYCVPSVITPKVLN